MLEGRRKENRTTYRRLAHHLQGPLAQASVHVNGYQVVGILRAHHFQSIHLGEKENKQNKSPLLILSSGLFALKAKGAV